MKYLFILILSIGLVACSDDDEDICIRGSGSLNTYDDITVGAFDKISISGPININYIQGATQDLVIRAEPELFAILEYEVVGTTLEVGFPRSAVCIDTQLGVTLDITVPNLDRIAAAGTSVIQTVNPIDQEGMVVDITGEAVMRMAGDVENMQIICSGVVTAENFDLITNTQRLDISGVAVVELYCEIGLTINVSGTANVSYKGNPQIAQNVTGTLNLVNAN